MSKIPRYEQRLRVLAFKRKVAAFASLSLVSCALPCVKGPFVWALLSLSRMPCSPSHPRRPRPSPLALNDPPTVSRAGRRHRSAHCRCSQCIAGAHEQQRRQAVSADWPRCVRMCMCVRVASVCVCARAYVRAHHHSRTLRARLVLLYLNFLERYFVPATNPLPDCPACYSHHDLCLSSLVVICLLCYLLFRSDCCPPQLWAIT